MTKKDKTADDPMGQVSEMMAQWQKTGLGAMNNMGAGWMEAMSDMGSEWLHFLSERVAKDVDFQHKLLHAKSPQDIQKIQSEFFQAAVDDYANETGKMVQLSRKVFEPNKDDG